MIRIADCGLTFRLGLLSRCHSFRIRNPARSKQMLQLADDIGCCLFSSKEGSDSDSDVVYRRLLSERVAFCLTRISIRQGGSLFRSALVDPSVSFARGEDCKSHPISECLRRFAKPHTVGQQYDRCRAEVLK